MLELRKDCIQGKYVLYTVYDFLMIILYMIILLKQQMKQAKVTAC